MYTFYVEITGDSVESVVSEKKEETQANILSGTNHLTKYIIGHTPCAIIDLKNYLYLNI